MTSTSTQPLYPTMDEMLVATSIGDRPLLDLIDEIQSLYLEDNKPWVIGFSGGKDSTTILSLIYVAITKLKKSQRHKHIYVISSDTLVETPMVVVCAEAPNNKRWTSLLLQYDF